MPSASKRAKISSGSKGDFQSSKSSDFAMGKKTYSSTEKSEGFAMSKTTHSSTQKGEDFATGKHLFQHPKGIRFRHRRKDSFQHPKERRFRRWQKKTFWDPKDAKISSRAKAAKRVICIGDLHGNLDKAKSLWSNLITTLGKDRVSKAEVVFLGDYCDRGPNTRGVLDWLIALGKRREKGPGGTHYLCGNHDFGMASFLGCMPCKDEMLSKHSLDKTRMSHQASGLWPHPMPPHGMHYMGRSWGGSHIYQTASTFKSYGVAWPDDINNFEKHRAFVDAVPEKHKRFLRRLKWVVDIPLAFAPGRLLAVHAGLNSSEDPFRQIVALKKRDIWDKAIVDSGRRGKFVPFSGRGAVESMPPQLEKSAILVSGHHGFVRTDRTKGRAIVDCSGGRPGEPIAAIVLPEWRIVSSEAKNSKP